MTQLFSAETIKLRILFCCAVAITFLCFVPTLFNEFLLTWDDGYTIVKNEHIRKISIDTFRWAFTEFYSEDWIPLVWISFALDHAFWGLNPVGYHLTNNVIHSLNAGLFSLISLALLKSYKAHNLSGDRIYYCSLLAALLFAIHPLRVESVAWAIERKDVLSLFFGLIALLAYLRYIQSQKEVTPTASTISFLFVPVYWVAVIFYGLSLMSKAMLVTLPLVLLILDWFPLNRINRKNLRTIILEKAPFLLLSGSTSAILMAVHTTSKMSFSESNLLSRILIAFKSITSYLLLTVWPANLSHFHLHPGNIQSIGFEYLFPLFLFIVITACCIMQINQRPVFIVVWLIYVITLVPVLGFTQVSSTAMADRYTYLPGLALSFLAALAVTRLAGKFSDSRIVNNTVTVSTLVVLLISGYLTVRQISFWKDDVTLWSRAIELQPHFSGRMYFDRAAAFAGKGDFLKALEDMNEAIAIATKKRRPNMEELYFKRAQIFRQLGETDKATVDYNYALSLMSDQK